MKFRVTIFAAASVVRSRGKLFNGRVMAGKKVIITVILHVIYTRFRTVIIIIYLLFFFFFFKPTGRSRLI